MPHRLTYDFRKEPEFSFEHPAQSCLALVDLESYPASPDAPGRNFDRLDLLQHLCAQMDALTATMWETPDANLRLRLLWAPDHHAVDQLHHSGHHVFAAGWVRTGGRIGLTSQDRLLDSARRGDPFLRSGYFPGTGRVRTLLVPPGTYDVTVFAGKAGREDLDYTVVLRHYPPPPPRLQPVRLHSFFLQDMAERAGGITSHAKDWTATARLA
jgi:hypothetical protein